MSDSGFIEHPVDMSDSSVDELEARDGTPKREEGPTPEEKIWDNFDGYAEFVNHMAEHEVPIFVERFLLEDTTLSIIGQGGTYVVSTGKLRQPIHSRHSRPFLLKASEEALNLGRPIESRSVEAGTAIVTKRIDFAKLKRSRAERRLRASEFLKPYQTEAAILSHPAIRANPAFPSLLGIGLQFSPNDVEEMPQLYPYMIMELGRQGSLEQSFRELWYGLLQRLPGSPGRYDINTIYLEIVLPWEWKLSLAREVSLALFTLHRLGVVHGDVKLSNTLALIPEIAFKRTDRDDVELIMSGQQLIQIGDFGSPILLSEVPVGGKARLQFHTPPWNAPELNLEIHRDDLVKTDIYSYGLLFARIMLQGASPFDEEFDAVSLLGCDLPRYDSAEIRKLQGSDKLDKHIYDTIRKTGFYSDEQLEVIWTVLRRTIRTETQERVGTLYPILEFLFDSETLGSRNGKSVAWDETDGIAALSLGGDLQAHVQIHNLWDDNFIGPLSAPDGIIVPNILDPAFTELRKKRVLLREVFEDFRRQIAQSPSEDSHMAQVHYQAAMCHFNGWGTSVNIGYCRIHLLKALSLGSIDALWRFQPVLGSQPSQSRFPTLEVETHPEIYHAMLAQFPGHADMCKAVQLQNISADLFQVALNMERSKFFEYSDGTRLKLNSLLLSNFMGQALSNGTDLSDVKRRHDFYPAVYQGHEDYADPLFIALCLAAAEGDMDSILKIFKHLENEAGLAIKDYLNRNTQKMIRDVRIIEIDEPNRSAKDISGPLPERKFVLEAQTHPLIMACSNGHSGVAVVLLAQGADPNQVNIAGRGPLHYLARFDPVEIEEVGNSLLEGQPDTLIHKVDNDGYSPLAFVLSVERNWVPDAGVTAARFLLKKGASWYNKDNPTATFLSPFVKAVLSLNIEAMQLVKDSVQSSINERPQEDSCRERSTHVIEDHKQHLSADIETDDDIDLGQTIFQEQIASAIVALAGEPDSVLSEREGTYGTTLASVIQFLIDSTHPFILPTMFPPIIRDIVGSGMVRLGLTLAAKLPSVDWSSETMRMMEASMSLAGRNFPDMLIALAEHGFNMDQVSKGNIDGNEFAHTFFHWAGYHRVPVELVRYIDHISPLKHQDTESDSPALPSCMHAFDWAVTSGHFEFADYLIRRGADIASPHLYTLKKVGASQHVTILGYVVTAVIPEAHNTPRRWEMLRYLLNLNPDPLVCPKLKMNVFHLVWRKWNHIGKDYFHPEDELKDAFDEVMDVFEQLHNHFADISLLTARDINGATPLHFAAGSGNIRGVQKLLKLGADATAEDNRGRSPQGYAFLEIKNALNYTVSGDPIPIQIDPKEVVMPILGIALRNRKLLEQGRLDRVARSVVLGRVLESIRKRRRAEDESGKSRFHSRREEPTEILVLAEIVAFLEHKYSEKKPGL